MSSARFAASAPTLCALLMAGVVQAAAGERVGAFAGGGLGAANADVSKSADVCYYYDCNSISTSDLVILEGHGGYRLTPNFAVEGKILGGSTNNNSYYNTDVTFGAVSVRAVGLMPVGKIVDLYALLGGYSGHAEYSGSGSESESGLVYGAGAQMNFGRRGNYGVRLEFELYDTSKLLDNVQVFTASFQYNFW